VVGRIAIVLIEHLIIVILGQEELTAYPLLPNIDHNWPGTPQIARVAKQVIMALWARPKPFKAATGRQGPRFGIGFDLVWPVHSLLIDKPSKKQRFLSFFQISVCI